jgi:hypothetical protein
MWKHLARLDNADWNLKRAVQATTFQGHGSYQVTKGHILFNENDGERIDRVLGQVGQVMLHKWSTTGPIVFLTRAGVVSILVLSSIRRLH